MFRLFLPVLKAVDVLGHAWVFPPPFCHGLLEGHDVNVFYPATVHGKVVGDVLAGGPYCNGLWNFQTPHSRVLDGPDHEGAGTTFGGPEEALLEELHR